MRPQSQDLRVKRLDHFRISWFSCELMTWGTEPDLLAKGLYEFYEHDFYEIFKFSRHLELTSLSATLSSCAST